MPEARYENVGSKRFNLSREDWESLGRGLLITLVGAALTYVSETLPNIDFGVWTPVVVALYSVLANFIRKGLSDTRERKLVKP